MTASQQSDKVLEQSDKNCVIAPLVDRAEAADAALRRAVADRDEADAHQESASADLTRCAVHPLPEIRRHRTAIALGALAGATGTTYAAVRLTETVSRSDGAAASSLGAALLFAAGATISGVAMASMLAGHTLTRTFVRQGVAAVTTACLGAAVAWIINSITDSLAVSVGVGAAVIVVGWLLAGRLHRGHQQRLDLEIEVAELAVEVPRLRSRVSDCTIALDRAESDLARRRIELDLEPLPTFARRPPLNLRSSPILSGHVITRPRRP